MDFFLISDEIRGLVESKKIKNKNKISDFCRGRGSWRFNNSLLKDLEYTSKVKQKINDAKLNYKNSNPGIFLDTLKAEIRGLTIAHSSYELKLEREEETNLNDQIKNLESQLSSNEDLLEKYSRSFKLDFRF